jgi:quercetin dioxygenase-like cupin family protein
MRGLAVKIGLVACGAMIGLSFAEVIHAQQSGFSTKQIFREDLSDMPGHEVVFFTSDWPPGFRLPWHLHEDGHEYVFVVQGEQTFEIDGVGTKVVKAGEVIHNPPNVQHYGRNATDKISKTLVVRIKAKDKPITTEVKR